MNLPLDIRPDALADIESAADWYEDKESGLGAAFVRMMCDAIASLAEGAYRHHIRNRRLRVRWLCARRFPYRIVYRIDNERVTILTVLHASRHDREWRRRV
jgi:plasmid stabilization system protein ParE